MAITEGAAPPAFTLPDQDGKPTSLADFAGQEVFVFFYPKDETPGCTKEACAFRDLWSEIQAEGATLLGVSPDDGESHRAFIANHDLPFTLLSDPDKQMMAEWAAWGEKVLYGRKSIGTIRSTVWVGADGKVVRHWRKVPNAAAHPEKVLQALRAR
jgi:peroxiredoxin Q/BCP